MMTVYFCPILLFTSFFILFFFALNFTFQGVMIDILAFSFLDLDLFILFHPLTFKHLCLSVLNVFTVNSKLLSLKKSAA